MKAEETETIDDQPLIQQLRNATSQLHGRLHEHPLIVELLMRPSLDCYRAVLEGFLRYYEPREPALVECARQLGAAEQYPRPDRTERLLADLKAIHSDSRRMSSDDREGPASPEGIADFVGSVYVIKGSALGGRAILGRLGCHLDLQYRSRFFTGDGKRTGDMWRAFQKFCNSACKTTAAKQAAIDAAKQSFRSIEDCLTSSMKAREFV